METHTQPEAGGLQRFSWHTEVLRGILLTGLGFYFIFAPASAFTLLVFAFGALLCLDSIFSLTAAITNNTGNVKRGVVTIYGLLSLLAGLTILTRPFLATYIAAFMYVWIVGFSAIMAGMINLTMGFRVTKGTSSDWHTVVRGIVLLAFGALFIGYPQVAGYSLALIFGIVAVSAGLYMLYDAFWGEAIE